MKLQSPAEWSAFYLSAWKPYYQTWAQMHRQVLICSMFNLILLKKITKS
ncbi:MAG: hypothetical protein RL368_19 [Pseudomonadota bacterium]|jgi:hypothetical protein